ncbi:bifunctional nuclease family protein [Flavobacteriales bacterium]|nr:bifunctional nuclease family protein [Flavobacteriales bacterium]
MNLVQLDIDRLEPSSSNKNSYVLLLREIAGERKLPIVIGPCNAGSIAIFLESNRKPERPLTHDIIKSITNNFHITVSRVVIHTLKEGVFHASFFCFMDGEEEIELDARTSDAIAIAIRMGCPIFTYEDILKEAGFVLTDDFAGYKDDNSEDLEVTKNILDTLSLGELNKQMKSAIEEEDYELASKLRDEINKRK